MAKTYVQLAKEIESLTKTAAALRKREMPTVIGKIKEAIDAYGLTADDLGFGSGAKTPAAPSKRATAPAKPAKKAAPTAGAKVPVKYRDDNGNSWTGRGSKPGWLQAALAAGQSLDSFAIDGGGASAPATATDGPATPAAKPTKAKPKSKAKPAKGGGSVKYKDDAGHTWSGFGPQPGWMKDALANGKTIDELRA